MLKVQKSLLGGLFSVANDKILKQHKKIIKKQKKMIKSVDKVNKRVYNITINQKEQGRRNKALKRRTANVIRNIKTIFYQP